MTYVDLVRRYFQRATVADAEFILWELTPYPCWDPREELAALATTVKPKKRGWLRRLGREYIKRDAELKRLLREEPMTAVET